MPSSSCCSSSRGANGFSPPFLLVLVGAASFPSSPRETRPSWYCPCAASSLGLFLLLGLLFLVWSSSTWCCSFVSPILRSGGRRSPTLAVVDDSILLRRCYAAPSSSEYYFFCCGGCSSSEPCLLFRMSVEIYDRRGEEHQHEEPAEVVCFQGGITTHRFSPHILTCVVKIANQPSIFALSLKHFFFSISIEPMMSQRNGRNSFYFEYVVGVFVPVNMRLLSKTNLKVTHLLDF